MYVRAVSTVKTMCLYTNITDVNTWGSLECQTDDTKASEDEKGMEIGGW